MGQSTKKYVLFPFSFVIFMTWSLCSLLSVVYNIYNYVAYVQYGNGCTFVQQERASLAAMQLLVLTSSLTDEIHLTLTNMTVTGFKHSQVTILGPSLLGGVFHLTSLASAQFLHVTCMDNEATVAGCVAFTGGHNIVIEDSM